MTFNDLWGQTSYKVLKRSDFKQKGYLGRSGILQLKVTFIGLWGHTSLFESLCLHHFLLSKLLEVRKDGGT